MYLEAPHRAEVSHEGPDIRFIFGTHIGRLPDIDMTHVYFWDQSTHAAVSRYDPSVILSDSYSPNGSSDIYVGAESSPLPIYPSVLSSRSYILAKGDSRSLLDAFRNEQLLNNGMERGQLNKLSNTIDVAPLRSVHAVRVGLGLLSFLAIPISLKNLGRISALPHENKEMTRREVLQLAGRGVLSVVGLLAASGPLAQTASPHVSEIHHDTGELLRQYGDALVPDVIARLDWVVTGRNALAAAKAGDIGRELGLNKSDRVAIVFGRSHSDSSSVYLTDINARNQAIRQYAFKIEEYVLASFRDLGTDISSEEIRHVIYRYLSEVDLVSVQQLGNNVAVDFDRSFQSTSVLDALNTSNQ